MIIGITGSLASGKSTVLKVLSSKKHSSFSADVFVRRLYKKIKFRKLISKSLKIEVKGNFKQKIKNILINDPKNIKILEKKSHPFVRKEMLSFIKKNRSKKKIFLEIPLLVESDLSRHFDKTIFISCPRKTRLKRYLGLGGDRRVFNILDKRQASFKRKKKYCDLHIVNNKSISLLKKKLISIFKNYD